MILFLDFDGVLHPKADIDEPVFCRTFLLWKILRACIDIKVVFSTSWREMYHLNEMRNFVTQGGGEDLSHRFVDVTPILKFRKRSYRREDECIAWLKSNGVEEQTWLALDDEAQWFKKKNLYLVDHQTGLTNTDVIAIIKRITHTNA